MGLTLYIGLAGLPLGIQGIEFQVQVMFGRFAGVDGAAGDLGWGCQGRASPAFLWSLKGFCRLPPLRACSRRYYRCGVRHRRAVLAECPQQCRCDRSARLVALAAETQPNSAGREIHKRQPQRPALLAFAARGVGRFTRFACASSSACGRSLPLLAHNSGAWSAKASRCLSRRSSKPTRTRSDLLAVRSIGRLDGGANAVTELTSQLDHSMGPVRSSTWLRHSSSARFFRFSPWAASFGSRPELAIKNRDERSA
jgi:hypothetical protein